MKKEIIVTYIIALFIMFAIGMIVYVGLHNVNSNPFYNR